MTRKSLLILSYLTHPRYRRMYASMKWAGICSGNDLSPVRCQAIIWNNAALLSIRPMETNRSEIWISLQNFSFVKIASENVVKQWQPFCSWDASWYGVIWATSSNHIFAPDTSLGIVYTGRQQGELWSSCQHIRVEANWPPFSRRHCNFHFLGGKFL